jgi:hypothetical protein
MICAWCQPYAPGGVCSENQMSHVARINLRGNYAEESRDMSYVDNTTGVTLHHGHFGINYHTILTS